MAGEQRGGGRRRERGGDDHAGAALTGGGPSLLGVSGSMRARDVSRPRPVDVEKAEKLVQVSYRPRSAPHRASGAPGPSQPDAGSGGSSRVLS